MSFKKIIQEIKKLAQDYDLGMPEASGTSPKVAPQSSEIDPNQLEAFGPHGHNVVKKQPSAHSLARSAGIKNMQNSILKLSEIIKNTSSDFNNYLAKQYGANLDISKNISADGSWGDKTQQALVNSYKLSTALFNISKDFGGTTKHSWNMNDNNELYQLIRPIDAKSKIKNAPAINDLLERLSNFYQVYSNQIMQTNTFKHIANPKNVIFSLGTPAPSNLTDDQGNSLLKDPQFLAQTIDVSLPSSAGQNIDVRVSLLSLFSKSRFQQFLQQSLGYNEQQSQNPQTQNTILSMIRSQTSSQ